MEFRLTQSPPLDGLRAISILLVLAAHIHLLAPDLPSIFVGGFLGVDVFFVISGFLITSLLLDEYDITGNVSLRRFYARRALRLLPALIAVLVYVCVLALMLGSLSVLGLNSLRLFSALAYFTNWLRAYEPMGEPWILAHAWSLSVEEQFYIVWPIALLALLKARLSKAAIASIVFGGAGVSMLLKAAMYMSNVPEQRIIYGSDTRAEPVLIGCLVALALHAGLVPRLVSENIRILSIVGLLVLVGFSVFLGREGALLYLGGFTIFGFSVAGIILETMRHPDGFLSGVLKRKWLVWLGKRSYGLYLWHWPMYELARVAGHRVLTPLIAVTLSLIVTALSYRYVESPFLALKKRYSSVGADKQPASGEPQFSQVAPAIAQ